jgi:hypothetical protein
LGAGLTCLAGAATAAVEDTFPREATRAGILRWLAGNSDLNPDTVVTMTDELVVAITSREDGRGVGRSTRLSLREEVINPDAAAAWGGRSIQLDLDLDCARHRVILGARRIYARPNLQGAVRITRSDNSWAEVPPDTVIDDVARAACSSKPTRLAEAPPARDPATGDAASAPAPPQSQAAAAEPPAAASAPGPAPVQVAAAEPVPAKVEPPPDVAPAAPAAAVPPAPAAPEPAPEPAQVAAAGPVHVSPPPAAEPAQPAQGATTTVAIAAPPPTGVVVVGAQPDAPSEPAPELRQAPADQGVIVHNPFADRTIGPREPAAPPAKTTTRVASAAAAPQRPADYAVQIAAAATADLAHDSWQSLKSKLPGLVGQKTFAVEPVSANGRTLYRALLLGFASPGEAADLCKALRSQSVDCILRQLK